MKTLMVVLALCCAAGAQTSGNIYKNADDTVGWTAHVSQGALGGSAQYTQPSEDGLSLGLTLVPTEAYQSARFTINLNNLGDFVFFSPFSIDYDYNVSDGNAPQAIAFGTIVQLVGWQCKMEAQFDYVTNSLKGWDAAADNGSGGWVLLNGGQTFGVPRPTPGWHNVHITGAVNSDGTMNYNHVDSDGVAQPVDTAAHCAAVNAPVSATMILSMTGNRAGTPYNVYIDNIKLSNQ